MVKEIARILRSGGRVAVSEPDYETTVIAGAEPGLSRRILANWIRYNRNPLVGRHLPGLMATAGLTDVTVSASGVTYSDFTTADYYLKLTTAQERATKDAVIGVGQGRAWVRDLQASSEDGRFLLAITMFTALARKPSPSPAS